MTTKNILTTFIFIVLCVECLYSSQEEDFVLNAKKSVSLMSVEDVYTLWSTIKIDHPKSRSVFVYSYENIDFALFYLPQKNIYVVFASPITGSDIKLHINDLDVSDEVEICYIKVSSIYEKDIGLIDPESKTENIPIGVFFHLNKNQKCDLSFKAFSSIGKYKIKLKYINNKWRGSMITEDNEVPNLEK